MRLQDVAAVTRADRPGGGDPQEPDQAGHSPRRPRGVDLGAAQNATRAALAEVTWPTGYAWSLGGKGQQMDEMKAVVKEIFGLAVFFSFLVLAVQFNSLRLPVAIFSPRPFVSPGSVMGSTSPGSRSGPRWSSAS